MFIFLGDYYDVIVSHKLTIVVKCSTFLDDYDDAIVIHTLTNVVKFSHF